MGTPRGLIYGHISLPDKLLLCPCNLVISLLREIEREGKRERERGRENIPKAENRANDKTLRTDIRTKVIIETATLSLRSLTNLHDILLRSLTEFLLTNIELQT